MWLELELEIEEGLLHRIGPFGPSVKKEGGTHNKNTCSRSLIDENQGHDSEEENSAQGDGALEGAFSVFTN